MGAPDRSSPGRRPPGSIATVPATRCIAIDLLWAVGSEHLGTAAAITDELLAGGWDYIQGDDDRLVFCREQGPGFADALAEAQRIVGSRLVAVL